MGIDKMESEQIIKKILALEWDMFTSVKNVNGRASCQDDKKTFLIMRKAQADVWSTDTLTSYLDDLESANRESINFMSIKYARMMEVTFPDEYENIKDRLPPISESVHSLVSEITKYHLDWSIEASKKYPKLFSLGRPVATAGTQAQHTISIENYLRSELLTYSEKTLKLCLKDTKEAFDNIRNLSVEILGNTAKSYGYDSLEEIEKSLLSVQRNGSLSIISLIF
ncbi:MAG: DUF4125 family protein [Desulfobacteraceae bacterium]|jgi:hypothetical protein